MRTTRPLILVCALLLALAPASALAQDPDHVIDGSQAPIELLFVMSAGSGSVEGDTLTLDAVPSVIYFSDRPARISGHMSVEDFVAGWDQGDDSFAADPPNGVISLLGAEDTVPQDSVIELTSAELDGDALRFGFIVLDGSLPEGAFGPASLFLDSASPGAATLIVPITLADAEMADITLEDVEMDDAEMADITLEDVEEGDSE